MTYKFVTLQEISELKGLPYKDSTWKLHDICMRLHAEREAYREVARNTGHVCHVPNCDCGDYVDAEAARLLEGKK